MKLKLNQNHQNFMIFLLFIYFISLKIYFMNDDDMV